MEKHDNIPRVVSWSGIRIVNDVLDERSNPCVQTLEGRIGPLLKGDGSQAHFIEMPPDLYCEEHSHATESLIFTVKGRWVLCSSGRRHLMQPGSLFWFKAGTPTGYEVPFFEPAFILIFKGVKDDLDDKGFLEYLETLQQRLEKAHADGTPFKMSELCQDHPARIFARSLQDSNSLRPDESDM
ncbi:MAG: AraC family ligand binding domain-containing protein [Methanothrix sp.]|nr:AraC family ligand binding domain-containing protein [Methanothrix sp.]